MTTTHDARDIAATKHEIIERLDGLSLHQLREVLALINSFEGASRGVKGPDLATRMQRLRDELQITDAEFDEFDRILREQNEAEKRRLEQCAHE
jgi:hypothetical protein